MKNSLYIKIAPYTTMATGIILIAYNLLLLQNPKYGQVDTYFIAGTMFVGTGITLLINRSIGIRMYAVLTWLATAFLCYVILLAFAAMANPFFLIGLLLNEQRQLSYGIQIGFYIGLVIYMHKTRRRLFDYGKKSDQPKRPWYKRAWVYVTALIAVPPLGLFMMWKYAPWRLRVKQIVTVPLILTSLIFFMTFAGILQGAADRSAQAGDEKVRMENFLEQKYAKKFTVKSGKIENGGDAMFGVRFKTYKAEVSPRDDPETVFSASRIVSGESLDGGADDPDEVNYHDEYLTTLWTNELRGQVEAAASGAPGNVFEFSFDVSLAGNRRSRAEFYQAIWGTVPRYSDLPAEHKKRLGYSAEVKVLGSVDSGNITAHAGTMMDIKQAMNPQDESFSTGVKYKVYRNRNDTTPGWEYYGRPSDLVSVERILPHFIGWGDRTGKYYNVNTGQFDLSHPLQ